MRSSSQSRKSSSIVSRVATQRRPSPLPRSSPLSQIFLFLKESLAVSSAMEESLSPLGVNVTQILTLYTLHSLYPSGEPACQRELAEEVGCSGGNMTQVLDQLESRGFVRRLRDPQDRRYIRVSLTPAGEELLVQAIPRCEEKLEELIQEKGFRFISSLTPQRKRRSP